MRTAPITLDVVVLDTRFTFTTREKNVGSALRAYLTRHYPGWKRATYWIVPGKLQGVVYA